MVVVLLSSDLMGMSRVEGAARNAGVQLRNFSSVNAAADFCAAEPVELVLVDLATPGLDVAVLVGYLRNKSAAKPPRIIAFGPHVHEAMLKSAADARCDQVLSRGAFMGKIDAMLAELAATK